MSIDIKDKNIVSVSLEEATQIPEGYCSIYKNKYWLIHPDGGLLFYNCFGCLHPQCNTFGCLHPQCNTDFDIADRIRSQLYPWATIEKVDTVFVKE